MGKTGKILLLLLLIAVGLLPAYAEKVKTGRVKPQAEQSDDAIRQEQEFKYFFYAAVQAMDGNRFDEALALFLHCHDIIPADAATAYYLGVLYGGLQNQEKMMYFFDEAYRLCPEEYWYSYAVQHYKADNAADIRKAVKALQKEIKRKPDDSHAAGVLQQLYINSGDIRQALSLQDVIDKADGVDMYSAIQRYKLNMLCGKTRNANNAISRYLQLDPDNYYMQVFLGDIMMQQGKTDEAYQQYSSVERNYPENPYLALSLSNYYGTTGNTSKAAAYELQAINNDIINLPYKLDVLHDYHWLQNEDSLYREALLSLAAQYPLEDRALQPLADYYLNKGDNAEATALYWTILDINPDNDAAWQTLLSLTQNDSTASTDDYLRLVRKAIVQMPEKQQWYYMMSLLQMHSQQRDSAVYYCRQGLQQPDDTDLHYKIALLIQLADIYTLQQQTDSAFRYYEAALAYNPENLYVLNNYAYTLAINGGDLRKAEKMSQRTIKNDPDNPTYLDTYAWILHLSGQETLARFYMQKAWDNSERKDDPEMVEHYRIIFGENNP